MSSLRGRLFPRLGIALSLLLALFFYAPHGKAQTPQTGAEQPDTLRQHFEAAGRFEQAGDQEHAAAESRAFLAEALHRIANGKTQAGQFDAAVPLFDEAVRLAPADPGVFLDYAEASFNADKLPKARVLAEKAAQLDPQNPRARFLYGRVLFHLEDYEAAKAQLEAAVALNSDFDTGYLLATTYLLLHDEQHARVLFDEMTGGFGDTPLIHIYFGRAYSQTDYPDQAVAEFQKAIAKDPKTPNAHYYLALAYLGHNEEAGFDKAIPEFRAELLVNPDDFRSHYMLGYIARKQRHLAEAESELARAVALNPEDLNSQLELAEVYTDLNRPADAEATLRKSIASAQDTPENRLQISRAHYQLGQILRRTGHAEEAMKELKISAKIGEQPGAGPGISADERAVSSGSLVRKESPDQQSHAGPKNVPPEELQRLAGFVSRLSPVIGEVYNNLGAIAAGRNEFAAAVNYFRKAGEWNPSLEGLDRNLGLASYYAGQFDQAVQALSRYLGTHADDSTARATLGLSYFKSKQFAKVIETLRPMESGLNANPELAHAYADSYYEMGKTQLEHSETAAAIASLETAAKLSPKSREVHRELAAAYRRGARPADADREMKVYESLKK